MSAIVIEDRCRIPEWVVDQESFRRWARSGEMPEHGWFSYLDGEIWVDLSKEQAFSHNLPKTKYTMVLGQLIEDDQSGYLFSDRMLLSHVPAQLSTEPDALFASYETMRTGRLALVVGAEEGYVELEGTPDMVLEIVSPSSVRKDLQVLRDLYARAGVAEYWLVDVRGASTRFEILRLTPAGYVSTTDADGWQVSTVFAGQFQLTRQTDPLGHPAFTLAVRNVAVS